MTTTTAYQQTASDDVSGSFRLTEHTVCNKRHVLQRRRLVRVLQSPVRRRRLDMLNCQLVIAIAAVRPVLPLLLLYS